MGGADANARRRRRRLSTHRRGAAHRVGRRGREPGVGDSCGAVQPAAHARQASPDGALYVGAPDTVAHKIAATVRTLGLSRFDLKYSNGALPHDACLASIELYATRVVPRVRELLSA